MYEEVGIGPFRNDEAESHLEGAAAVFAAEDPPVGFASVDLVDGLAHLWQLSVLPDFQGRGLGTALIEAACDWSQSRRIEAVTLTTFQDVPWNGPFYARRGFRIVSRLTPGLSAIRKHEKAIGDDAFGTRMVMRLDLR